MRTLVSRLAPSGFLVLARVPDGAAVLATFVDDGQERDLTEHVADLLLSGALDRLEATQTGRPDPAETVEAVTVRYLEPAPAPGALREPASFSWAGTAPGVGAGDFDPSEVLPLLVRGLTVEITAAVAHESAQAALADLPEGGAADDDDTTGAS